MPIEHRMPRSPNDQTATELKKKKHRRVHIKHIYTTKKPTCGQLPLAYESETHSNLFDCALARPGLLVSGITRVSCRHSVRPSVSRSHSYTAQHLWVHVVRTLSVSSPQNPAHTRSANFAWRINMNVSCAMRTYTCITAIINIRSGYPRNYQIDGAHNCETAPIVLRDLPAAADRPHFVSSFHCAFGIPGIVSFCLFKFSSSILHQLFVLPLITGVELRPKPCNDRRHVIIVFAALPGLWSVKVPKREHRLLSLSLHIARQTLVRARQPDKTHTGIRPANTYIHT